MKKLKKFLVLILLILVIMPQLVVNASDSKTELKVIEKNSETKYLENDQGMLDKEIISCDSEKGEVTVELKLSNITKDNTQEDERYENTEIFIIVSENIVNNNEKLDEYTSYIDTLAKKVFEKSSTTKIGIVGIKGTIYDGEVNENGSIIWGENDGGKIAGTADNAEIVLNQSRNTEDIKTKLQSMNTNKLRYRENLQAAIRLANNSYSDNVNKILILLYDGVPDIAIGVKSEVNYGMLYEHSTAEEAIAAKHENIATKTRDEILTLKDNSVNFILLRPDDTSYDEEWYSQSTGEKILDFDGSPYVQKIYGTIEEPTHGKMYTLKDNDLEEIVTEYIYQDVIEDIRADIKSATIKEYFSQDILENFDITFSDEYVDTSNLSDSNYIVWNIGDLAGNNIASLKYTLKIKDMKNEQLLNKIISTSEKSELSYINNLDEEAEIESTSSPKIKLEKIVQPTPEDNNNEDDPKPENPNNKQDNTVAKVELPNTGKILLAWSFIIILVAGTIAQIRYNKLYK